MSKINGIGLWMLLSFVAAQAVAPAACEPSRVYDALIVYGIDQEVPNLSLGIFEPMNSEDNTAEFRETAVAFFESQWGLTGIDPNALAGPAPVGVGTDCIPFVNCDYTAWMVQLPDSIRYQVFAIDYQEVPQLRHRLPITNVRMLERTAIVVVGPNDIVNTGVTQAIYPVLKAGSILSFGIYKMTATDKNGNDFLLDTIRFKSQQPSLANAYFWQAVACTLESDLFGAGLTRGGGTAVPPVPQDVLSTMITMTFPVSLTEKVAPYSAKCKNVKPDLFN